MIFKIFDIPKDGIFEISHIILPSDKWINSTEELDTTSESIFDSYNNVYYYDTTDNNFKSYKKW